MTILITGGTGLLGQYLIKKLLQEKYSVYNITRRSTQSDSDHYKEFVWSEGSDKFPLKALKEVTNYGVIHLAGEPVSSWPWTKKKKEKIYFSRVNRTQQLVSVLKKFPPQFFISASAVGIYGEQKDIKITEKSSIMDQNFFLQKVCFDWEASALKANSFCRSVIFRLGVVLSYKKAFLHEQYKWI
ncbi:MAG: NAD-dependent epimerase/dehydratase family protein, partial [Bdellovibrionaceae bacterium]|nr:NAD-dependent epimerase/dehydratase family protein [Pseudobdellovibrionaceae bacterium]